MVKLYRVCGSIESYLQPAKKIVMSSKNSKYQGKDSKSWARILTPYHHILTAPIADVVSSGDKKTYVIHDSYRDG